MKTWLNVQSAEHLKLKNSLFETPREGWFETREQLFETRQRLFETWERFLKKGLEQMIHLFEIYSIISILIKMKMENELRMNFFDKVETLSPG